MDKIDQLIEFLESVMKDNVMDSEEKLNSTINRISSFYIDHFNTNKDEVAIFLVNESKKALSFVYPRYLVGSDEIPINSEKAIVSSVFRSGESRIDNHFLEKERLFQYEFIKTDEDESKFIWKSMISVIYAWDEKIGVIQLSRKRSAFKDVGEDFTEKDMKFLESSIYKLAPFIKTFMHK